MPTETVYQTIQFEVISINAPDVDEVLEDWGIPEALDEMPAETLSQVRQDNGYLIMNKSNGSVGLIDPVTLSMSFEESHPSEGLSGIRKTTMEKIIDRANNLSNREESDEFFRGLNEFSKIIQDVQNERN